jgi:hypothetical protein
MVGSYSPVLWFSCSERIRHWLRPDRLQCPLIPFVTGSVPGLKLGFYSTSEPVIQESRFQVEENSSVGVFSGPGLLGQECGQRITLMYKLLIQPSSHDHLSNPERNVQILCYESAPCMWLLCVLTRHRQTVPGLHHHSPEPTTWQPSHILRISLRTSTPASLCWCCKELNAACPEQASFLYPGSFHILTVPLGTLRALLPQPSSFAF